MKRMIILMNLLLTFCVTSCNTLPTITHSYYNDYTAKGEEDRYEVSGKAYVADTKSVLYVTCREQTSLDICGELKDITGVVQMVYINADNEDVIIAEVSDLDQKMLRIDTNLSLDKGDGRIEFRGEDASFKFKLLFEYLDQDKLEYVNVVENEKMDRILNEGEFTYTNDDNDCTVLSTRVNENTKVKVKVTTNIASDDAESRMFFDHYRLAYRTEQGTIIDVVEYKDKAVAFGGYESREKFEKDLVLPRGTNELILSNGEGENYELRFHIEVIEVE